ncbi:MAG: ABC transporter permease [Anaerolineae bacterium]
MLRYTISRALQFIPTILGIYALTFFIMRILPGDPAQVILGDRATPENLDNLRRVMHLDQPLLNQFTDFLLGAVRGDLGQSLVTKQPVSTMIGTALGPTAVLASCAMLIAVCVGVPLGILSAVRKDLIWDNAARSLSLAGVSIPGVLVGAAISDHLRLAVEPAADQRRRLRRASRAARRLRQSGHVGAAYADHPI